MKSLFGGFLILWALAGCAPAGSSHAPEHGAQNADSPNIQLLRNTVSFAYEPYESPREMLEAADVVVSGEIVSVDTALIEDDLEPSGAVIVGVHPQDEAKRGSGDAGDTVYYWFDRPTSLDVGVYRDALPLGTHVVLFGMDTRTSSDTRFLTPVPEPIFSPEPQGLFLSASENDMVNIWGDDATGWPEIDSPQELLHAALQETP